MYFSTLINGGAGKTVMFSGVAKNLKKAFPDKKLIAVTAYPELLLNNPDFWRVYKTGATPYFNEDFVNDSRGDVVSVAEPYHENDYLQGKMHLIQVWSKMLGCEDTFQMPSLYVSHHEINVLHGILKDRIKNNKPILAFQPFGGVSSRGYNWNRDIPHAQALQIVEKYGKDYQIVHIGHKEQTNLPNTYPFQGTFREVACLIALSQKRIFIDSACQHIAAAMGRSSTVLWVTNTPDVFGYSIHRNITARNPDFLVHKVDSCFQEQNFLGEWGHYYPYVGHNVFDLNEVFEQPYHEH